MIDTDAQKDILPTHEEKRTSHDTKPILEDCTTTSDETKMMLNLRIDRVLNLSISGWGLVIILIISFLYTESHYQSTKSKVQSQILKHAEYQAIPKWTAEPEAKPLVPFEAHIMSKCPDAQVCLRNMVLPAMQRVLPKVNFTLSYIGTPTASGGVACMHGAPECMGNILELCAASLYRDPKIYLGFTMCLTRDYQDIPDRDLVEDCALEHGIDFEKLNECASDEGGGGAKMLSDSVQRSQDVSLEGFYRMQFY